MGIKCIKDEDIFFKKETFSSVKEHLLLYCSLCGEVSSSASAPSGFSWGAVYTCRCSSPVGLHSLCKVLILLFQDVNRR